MKLFISVAFLGVLAALSPAPTYLPHRPNTTPPRVQSLEQREAEQAASSPMPFVGEAPTPKLHASHTFKRSANAADLVAGAGAEVTSGNSESGAAVVRSVEGEVKAPSSPLRTLLWALLVSGLAFGSVQVFRLWADKNLPSPKEDSFKF